MIYLEAITLTKYKSPSANCFHIEYLLQISNEFNIDNGLIHCCHVKVGHLLSIVKVLNYNLTMQNDDK